ncbi:hypothetical protein [Mesorhizobium sp. URHB0026]
MKDWLDGSDWVELIRHGRAILPTESSIAVIDRNGQSADRSANAKVLRLMASANR